MQKKWIIAIPLILVLLALCVLISVIGLFSVRGFRFRGFSLPAIAGTMNVSVEEMQESQYSVSGPARLSVNNVAGKVRVEKSAGSTITVESKKTARGYDQQSALANLERLQIFIIQDGDAVDIRVEVEPLETSWSGQVDFTILVPEDTEVGIASNSGDLYLAGTRGAADLTTTFGAVTVFDVGEGPLTVNTRNGRVEAIDVQAGDQDVTLLSSFGDVTLRNAVADDVTIKSNNGKLALGNVEAAGMLELRSDFGRINVEDSSAGLFVAKTQNGEIELNDLAVTGKLTASSDFGTIRLTQVQADGYDLLTRNGGVKVDSATGSISARSSFGDVVIENARDATLDLRSNNGAIRFAGSLGAGPHNLHSDFGAIEIRVPGDTPLNLDLKTSFGKIQTDFEVSLKGSIEKEHIVGKINGGGDLLTATTKNGNITIENWP